MKTIAAVIFLIFLSGCAATNNQASKAELVSSLKAQPIGYQTVEQYPQYYRCFNRDKRDAALEIERLWSEGVDDHTATWAAIVSEDQRAGTGQAIAESIVRKYIFANAKNWTTEGLTLHQKHQCSEFYKWQKPTFLAAVK